MKKSGLLFVLALLCSDDATAQTPYFQGKTIRIIVGYPSGSAHDLWGRLIATQLNKHISGNPATVVQNMPGAGSMTATNYVYSVAKPDGQTVVINNAALYFEQLLKKKEVQYDWAKFTWIGSMTPTSVLLYMWAAAPYKTIHDVRTATVPPKCGAFSVQTFFGREPFNTWRSKNLVRVLVQGGKKRDPRLPETPLLSELMDQYNTSEANRRLVTVVMGSGEFGSAPMLAPPGIPAEHVKILRTAYAKALTSPELIADAKKQGLDVELIHGDALEALAREVMNQPADVIASMKKVMGE